jgi:hypothetical protein
MNRGQELVIRGYRAGKPFDALIVGYCEGGKLLLCRQDAERIILLPCA